MLWNVYLTCQVHKDMFVSKWPTGRGAVAPYCIQVKSLKVTPSASPRNPRKNKPPCLTFAETLVATGSPYNSYQLPLKCKQRLVIVTKLTSRAEVWHRQGNIMNTGQDQTAFSHLLWQKAINNSLKRVSMSSICGQVVDKKRNFSH